MGKGSRYRDERKKERKMREAGEAMYNRIEAMVNDLDNMPEGPYFTCSFDTEHDETCHVEDDIRIFSPTEDKKIPCIELTKMEVAIFHERKRWDGARMEIGAVTIPDIETSSRVANLEAIIKDKLGVTQEELDASYQHIFFDNLVTARTGLQGAVEEMHRRARTAEITEGILGANGKPILH